MLAQPTWATLMWVGESRRVDENHVDPQCSNIVYRADKPPVYLTGSAALADRVGAKLH